MKNDRLFKILINSKKCLLYFLLVLSFSIYSQQSNSKKIESLIKKSILQEENGNITGAIKTGKEILEIDPNNKETKNTLAGLYGVLQDFKMEIFYAKQAIEIDSNYINGYINLANGYLGFNNLKLARENLNIALHKNENNPIIHYTLGISYEMEGLLNTAKKHYKKSIEVDSTFENGYFNLAMIYANLKEFDLAVKSLEQLIRINPNDKESKTILVRLQEEYLNK